MIPTTSFVAGRFGSKRTYIVSLAAFTLGSALCSVSWSPPVLVVFRILQGAGGAILLPKVARRVPRIAALRKMAAAVR